MKIAYIILAHNYPAQLKRLIESLSAPETYFFIHIDKKVDISPFAEALIHLGADNYLFLRRNKVYWGEWGMIEAETHGLRKALADRQNFDYICLLSGQDYPIKSHVFMENFLSMNYGKSYLSFTPMPVKDWNWGPDGGMDRLTHYYARFGNCHWVYPPQQPPDGYKSNFLYLASKLFFRLPRNHPVGIMPYAGATWWILHRETAQYILDFIQRRPDFVHFHKHTALVDEIFIQSILCNAGPKIYSTLVNNDLRFIDWSNRDANLGHPEILTMHHRSQIALSDALFARKFDLNIDSEILDWIDQNLLNQNENSDNFSSAAVTV